MNDTISDSLYSTHELDHIVDELGRSPIALMHGREFSYDDLTPPPLPVSDEQWFHDMVLQSPSSQPPPPSLTSEQLEDPALFHDSASSPTVDDVQQATPTAGRLCGAVGRCGTDSNLFGVCTVRTLALGAQAEAVRMQRVMTGGKARYVVNISSSALRAIAHSHESSPPKSVKRALYPVDEPAKRRRLLEETSATAPDAEIGFAERCPAPIGRLHESVYFAYIGGNESNTIAYARQSEDFARLSDRLRELTGSGLKSVTKMPHSVNCDYKFLVYSGNSVDLAYSGLAMSEALRGTILIHCDALEQLLADGGELSVDDLLEAAHPQFTERDKEQRKMWRDSESLGRLQSVWQTIRSYSVPRTSVNEALSSSSRFVSVCDEVDLFRFLVTEFELGNERDIAEFVDEGHALAVAAQFDEDEAFGDYSDSEDEFDGDGDDDDDDEDFSC